MKKILAFALTTLLATPALATDGNKPFIGIGFGQSKASVTADTLWATGGTVLHANESISSSEAAGFLRLGTLFDQYRIYAELSGSGHDDGVTLLSLVGKFDWVIRRGHEPYAFYIGAHAGVIRADKFYDEATDGLQYGLQAGIIFDLDDRLNLDIGYNYSLTSLRQDMTEYDPGNDYFSEEVELDRIQGFQITLNYQF